MKKILCLLTFSILISCNSSNSSYERTKTAEELKMELRAQEQSQPQIYLQADGKYKENFWGDKLKVQCVVKNTATLATFKDAVLKVSYYSKTHTEIGNKEITLYEIFLPNTTQNIELKIDNYKDVSSIGWSIINATPIQ